MKYEVTGLEDKDGHAKKCLQAKCVHSTLKARISYAMAKSKKEEKFSTIFLGLGGGGSHTIRQYTLGQHETNAFFFFTTEEFT